MSEINTAPLVNLLSADIEFLPQLQKKVSERLEADGMSSRARYKAQLILEEIYVNVVHYAYPERPGEFLLEYGYSNGAARLIAFDCGRPFNPLEHPDPQTDLPLEARPIGGLGIMLLKHMASSVGYTYENGCNRLDIVIKNE